MKRKPQTQDQACISPFPTDLRHQNNTISLVKRWPIILEYYKNTVLENNSC